jgi:hypothetical protein
MKNPDLSDFLHAVGFYGLSVIIAFFAAGFESLGSEATSFAGAFVTYYAFAFLALLSFAGFVLGTLSAYAGVLSLKGGSK